MGLWMDGWMHRWVDVMLIAGWYIPVCLYWLLTFPYRLVNSHCP